MILYQLLRLGKYAVDYLLALYYHFSTKTENNDKLQIQQPFFSGMIQISQASNCYTNLLMKSKACKIAMCDETPQPSEAWEVPKGH
jgi:hypothetical protein